MWRTFRITSRSEPARAWVAGMLVLSASILLMRGTVEVVRRVAPPALWDRETGRLATAIRAARQVNLSSSEEGPVALIVGTSVTQNATLLSTKAKVFNLGFTAATPDLENVLAEKVSAAFRRANRRASLVLLEFLPQHATRAAARSFIDHRLLRSAVFFGPLDLFRHFLRSPGEASTILAMKLSGLVTPEIITNVMTQMVYGYPAPGAARPADPSLRARRILANVAFQKSSFDLIDLDIDPAQIDVFIDTVRLYKAFSDRTIVFMPPNNVEIWKHTAIGQQRRAEAIRRIELETGLEVHDLSRYGRFEAEDFQDATHLNESAGVRKLSEALTRLAGASPGI